MLNKITVRIMSGIRDLSLYLIGIIGLLRWIKSCENIQTTVSATVGHVLKRTLEQGDAGVFLEMEVLDAREPFQ